MSTIVEFFGPPGVGKSVLANELFESYNSEEKVIQPTYSLAHEAGRWRSHVYKLRHVVSALSDSTVNPPAGDLKSQPIGTIRATYNWLFISNILTQSTRDDMLILDQGIIQASWSFAYMASNSNYEEMIAEGLKYTPADQIYIIVYLTAPLDTISRRLKNRRKGAEPVELQKDMTSLSEAATICEDIASVLRTMVTTRGSTYILQINNDDSVVPKESADRLRRAIDEVGDN